MNDIVIQGGRVIDPASGRDEIVDVAISDGCVAQIGGDAAKAREVIDASGMIVCPGLIDIHVHCREPGHEEEETIATAAAAAAAGGFTTILAMPNTHPPLDNEAAIQYVLQQSARAGQARVLPVGCITKGREGKELAEIGMMLAAGAVAFSDDGDGVASAAIMQRALQYARMLDVVIMQHCQDPDLSGGVMNSGAVAVRLGLSGIGTAGEEIMLRRDLALLERTASRYHVQHVSSAGSVSMIRWAQGKGLRVTAEATPHHLLLTDAACMTYDSNYKVNPPLRSADDVDAVRQGVVDGTICCLATDHAPHAAEEKEMEFGLAPFGMIGLECAMGLYVKALIEPGLMDWPDLIARMTTGPAGIIGPRHPELGRLNVGDPADVTVIHPRKRWTVNASRFLSRSRNCPFDGWTLRGRAAATIAGGKVVYRL